MILVSERLRLPTFASLVLSRSIIAVLYANESPVFSSAGSRHESMNTELSADPLELAGVQDDCSTG